MIITVFGATGKVGKRAVRMALAQGHKVRAFVRNVEPYLDESLRNENFAVIKGYLFDANEVYEAVNGSDAVLSALGGAVNGTDKTRSLGIKNITEQMERAAVKRIIAVGSSGVLKDDSFGFALNNPKFPTLYHEVASEHLTAYEYMESSSLDWTFICCPDITDKDVNDKFVTSKDYAPVPNLFTIKAGNVARFMLNELNENKYIKSRVGISDIEP